MLQITRTVDLYRALLPEALIVIAFTHKVDSNILIALRHYLPNVIIVGLSERNGEADETIGNIDVLPPQLLFHISASGTRWELARRLCIYNQIRLYRKDAPTVALHVCDVSSSDVDAFFLQSVVREASFASAIDPETLEILNSLSIAPASCVVQTDDMMLALYRLASGISTRGDSIGLSFKPDDDNETINIAIAALQAAESERQNSTPIIFLDPELAGSDKATSVWRDLCIKAIPRQSPYSTFYLPDLLNSVSKEWNVGVVFTSNYTVAITALCFGSRVVFIADGSRSDRNVATLLHAFGDSNLAIVKSKEEARATIALLHDMPTTRRRADFKVSVQFLADALIYATAIAKSTEQFASQCQARAAESALAAFRDNAVALMELQRRIAIMERYEANLELELSSTKSNIVVMSQKKVRKFRKVWRQVRERLGLRKNKRKLSPVV